MPTAPKKHRPRNSVGPRPKSHDELRRARQAKQYDKDRGTSAQRGYDADWRRVRAQVISAHPFCERCGAIEALQVDHIEPFEGKSDPRRLERTNLRVLCASCHTKRSNAETGAGWRGVHAKARGKLKPDDDGGGGWGFA